MNVLIIGATGTIGQAVRETLINETDDNLTLFSRNIDNLNINVEREKTMSGNALSLTDLTKAIRHQDVVFVSLSGQLDKMAQNIVETMIDEGVQRLIFITSMGIYNEIPNSLGEQGNLKSNSILKPYRRAADIIEHSSLDYTIIRPGWFDTGNDIYEITKKGEPFGGRFVSVSAIANLVKRLIHDRGFGHRESLGINRPVDSIRRMKQ